MNHSEEPLESIARSLLSYNARTGLFSWIASAGRVKAGSVAGTVNSQGYVVIGIGKKKVLAHRLAWFFVHGRWPLVEIDHRDGARANNRIKNLREATHAQNHQNRQRNKSNSSGYLGAYRVSAEKWASSIKVGGQVFRLGRHESAEAANAAYLAAKEKLHTFQPMPR